jgi:multiple sugar transport system substrate-binding protein
MSRDDASQKLAIADALDALRAGRLGRRGFVRTCAAAGLGLAAVRLLAGCNRPSRTAQDEVDKTVGPLSAIDPKTDQHKFLREVGHAFAGTKLKVVGEDTPPAEATIRIMRKEFVPLTGIEVEWEQLPLDRVLAKVAADTARQMGAHDIFYLDASWLGRFGDDMADPRALLARKDLAYPGFEFEDILAPLVEYTASYKGRLVGIPYDIPIHIIIYRRDLFEELRLSPPRTIPEYLAAVRAIHQAKAPQVYGTAGMWKPGHYSVLVELMTHLWAHGGSFYGRDGRPAIDDERAVAAAEYMLELGKYMPPGATTWDWTGEATQFAQGKVGMYNQAGEWFALFDDPARSKVVGLVEAAPCPRELMLRPPTECSFDERPGSSRQGGSCLAISRHCRAPEAAWIFLQWATSSDVTTRASLLGGGASPIRLSNYRDPRVRERAKHMLGSTRFFDATLDAITHRMGSEPHLPRWPDMVSELTIELGKLTTGQQDVRATLGAMARIQAATGER